jgi:adenine-specific DNA-methyltransferase
MLVASSLGSEDMKVAQKALQLSKNLSEKLHLKQEQAGRIVYSMILNDLSIRIGAQFRFKDKIIDSMAVKDSNEVVSYSEQIIRNPQLLDLLYEDIVSPSYRKKFGQFSTPNYIAEFMAAWINQDKPKQVLDPAVGPGIFLENIVKTSQAPLSGLWGFDIDPLLLNACQIRLALQKFPDDLLHLIKEDFLGMSSYLSTKVDSCICNPPYLNFHDFDRNGLIKVVEEHCGVKLSRLTNIYVLFFLQSLSLTRIGGRLAFITPSEFLYTGYGEELKDFLLKNSTVDALILIDFGSSVFNKALTTAVLTLFRRGVPKSKHKVRFIRIYTWPDTTDLLKAVAEGVKDAGKYRMVEFYQDELDANNKWLEYFVDIKNGHVLNKLVPLSQLTEINRGIATGFNKYFVLSKSEIRKWKIEERFVVPVVSNAHQIKGYDFTVDDWNRLAENREKVYLLYVFEEPSENLKRYIECGEQDQVGANQRYITKHRSPWYSMEKRLPAKILATVFHRKEMKFILNSANVRNLATFHCVYPKFKDTRMVKALLAYLNSNLCREIQIVKRREYGGGLHKFEPSDLENIPTLDITRLELTDVDLLASLFDVLCLELNNRDREKEIRNELDAVLQHLIADCEVK